MIRWSKAQLREELLKLLGEQLQVAERAHQGSLEGATHEEARPENSKDTRALEQSYLARGQAQRLVELRESIAKLQATPAAPQVQDAPCTVGSLVELADDDRRLVYWIALAGGGAHLAAGSIQVLTPQSPLGRALIGCRVGDDVEVQLGGRMRTLEILSLG